jgi:hypothetical protein
MSLMENRLGWAAFISRPSKRADLENEIPACDIEITLYEQFASSSSSSSSSLLDCRVGGTVRPVE